MYLKTFFVTIVSKILLLSRERERERESHFKKVKKKEGRLEFEPLVDAHAVDGEDGGTSTD